MSILLSLMLRNDMMRNTPPADEFAPQPPPVTTRGDLAVGYLKENEAVDQRLLAISLVVI
jgi:hypothetical protein